MLLSMKDGPLCTSILLSRRAVSILYAVLVALPKRAAAFVSYTDVSFVYLKTRYSYEFWKHHSNFITSFNPLEHDYCCAYLHK
ncbi:unnamed protein product [Ixodes pacificus]